MNDAAIAYVQSLRQDPHPTPDYRVCREAWDIGDYFYPYCVGSHLGEANLTVFQDTESLPDGSPYCLTFSHTPGTGRLIYARDHGLISLYDLNVLKAFDPIQGFHNYLHDVAVWDQLRLQVGDTRFVDTIIRAYGLCLGGGGDDDDSESKAGRGSLSLKALAYRHLNMKMTSFKDTVYPHSIPHLLKWLWAGERVFRKVDWVPTCTCGHPQSHHAIRGKAGRRIGACGGLTSPCPCERYKTLKPPKRNEEDTRLDGIYLKTTNLIFDLTGGEKPDLDPWKRIKEWDASDRDAMTEVLGPYPLPSIEFVPEPELLWYACRDADATGRLSKFLDEYERAPWIFYR